MHFGRKIENLGLLLVISLVLLSSCNPTKKLKENEYLLEKNYVIHKHNELDEGEISSYIRQKPNRKILKAINFQIWLYNKIDQPKMKRIKDRRNKKYDQINSKRIVNTERKNKEIDAKNQKITRENLEREKLGKHPKKLKKLKKPKLKDKDKLTFRENLLEIGEAPIVLDTFLTKVSKEQIQKFLATKGFFNSRVSDSIVRKPYKKLLFFKYKKRRAYVYYKISTSLPYKIRKLNYQIDDPQIEYYVLQDSSNCLIKVGARYDVDVLQKERERLIKNLKNNGFFNFSQDYIYFKVDSNLKSNQLDVSLGIKKFLYKPPGTDTVVRINHIRYTINSIYIIQNYQQGYKGAYKDTILFNDVYFLSNGDLPFRKKDIANKILFSKGQVFVNDVAEETYGKLTDLRVFKNVNLKFVESNEFVDRLDCFIELSPVMKQNFTVETEGTNTSGNLGVAGSIVYQNRNLFKGAELFEFKVKGGLTAQTNFPSQENASNNLGLSFLKSFNTFQFGPELDIYIPKQLFPFTVFHFNKNASPKTVFISSLNYQQRPEFARTLSNISYGFQFRSGQYIRQNIIPFEFNVIKANLSGSFEDALKQSNDLFLINSFSDRIISASRYSMTYNNQTPQNMKKKVWFTYLKVDLESSGNVLRGIYNLSNMPKDSLDRYSIINVPFSHYLRLAYDYRVYKTIRKLSRLVLRAAGGVGKPLQNLRVLPYEKSFFGGGPNSVRAWRARTLGPGGYSQENDISFDKIGDAQLEFNLEYRFNLYKFLNAAWFMDAGNIWLRKPDAAKPLADFKLNRFYKEFATGSGFGLRADFDFFILRLDAAFPLYNPSYAEGERWMFDKQFLLKGVLNFGIGYPF